MIGGYGGVSSQWGGEQRRRAGGRESAHAAQLTSMKPIAVPASNLHRSRGTKGTINSVHYAYTCRVCSRTRAPDGCPDHCQVVARLVIQLLELPPPQVKKVSGAARIRQPLSEKASRVGEMVASRESGARTEAYSGCAARKGARRTVCLLPATTPCPPSNPSGTTTAKSRGVYSGRRRGTAFSGVGAGRVRKTVGPVC